MARRKTVNPKDIEIGPVHPDLKAQMRREVERFLAAEGLSPKAMRQQAQQAIIDRLGKGADAAAAAGFVRAGRGKPGGDVWEAAKRAFARAKTGEQELTDPKYLRGLRAAATPAERARLDRAEAMPKGSKGQVQWPRGAAVRVTVAGQYAHSKDRRNRSDLWAELEGSDLQRLAGDEPWEAWDARKGLYVGGRDGQHYMPDLSRELTEVHSVTITWVDRGRRDDRPMF